MNSIQYFEKATQDT